MTIVQALKRLVEAFGGQSNAKTASQAIDDFAEVAEGTALPPITDAVVGQAVSAQTTYVKGKLIASKTVSQETFEQDRDLGSYDPSLFHYGAEVIGVFNGIEAVGTVGYYGGDTDTLFVMFLKANGVFIGGVTADVASEQMSIYEIAWSDFGDTVDFALYEGTKSYSYAPDRYAGYDIVLVARGNRFSEPDSIIEIVKGTYAETLEWLDAVEAGTALPLKTLAFALYCYADGDPTPESAEITFLARAENGIQVDVAQSFGNSPERLLARLLWQDDDVISHRQS